jgi:general secretion pathway protein F
MPTFAYKAADADGEVVSGTLQAATSAEAVSLLHAKHCIPIRVEPLSGARRQPLAARRWHLGPRRVTGEMLAAFTTELATLLQAGVALDRALAITAELASNDTLRTTVLDVHDRVKAGASLAGALENNAAPFGRFYINMVRAGEAGGALESVLLRLAEHLEQSKALRDELVSALVYPAILVCVALGSVYLLMSFVVPQFAVLFDSVDQVLPLATRITLASAELLRDFGWVSVLALVAAVWLARLELSRPSSRLRWDAWLLRWPLVGGLVLKLEVARFARTLGILLNNGVTLLAALGIVRDTVGNAALALDLEKVEQGLRAGRGLTQPLEETGRFPALALHMIQVGEESGRLEELLLKVADNYEKDLQRALKRAMSVLEPVLILLLGLLIGGVVMSILVAIMGINQLVI